LRIAQKCIEMVKMDNIIKIWEASFWMLPIFLFTVTLLHSCSLIGIALSVVANDWQLIELTLIGFDASDNRTNKGY